MKSARKWTMLAAMAVAAAVAHATTVIPVSVERLAKDSTYVVVGQAEDSWTEWNTEHTIIYTKTRFRVASSLKGQSAETVIVKQMGGRNGSYMQKVAGVRYMANGESAVLFLRPSQAQDGTMAITGLMQGQFRITKSRATGQLEVSNGISGVLSYDPAKKTVGEYSGARMSLNELATRVQKAVQQ